MTKAELIEAIYEQYDGDITKKQCVEICEGVFEQMAKAIKKDRRFSYQGFGTFTLRQHKAGMMRNPQTGEPCKVKARKSIGFRCSKKLKEKL